MIKWQRHASSDVAWPLMDALLTTALKHPMYHHVSYFCVVDLKLLVLQGQFANVVLGTELTQCS